MIIVIIVMYDAHVTIGTGTCGRREARDNRDHRVRCTHDNVLAVAQEVPLCLLGAVIGASRKGGETGMRCGDISLQRDSSPIPRLPPQL
jgi:hypothetical protein